MSPSGQDAEEAAELMATMRADHVNMKAWYNHPDRAGDLSGVKDKHGASFPAFWQDLVKWDGWKDARREYLLFTENGGRGGGERRQPRKKRSRWATAEDGGAPPERARRSRWARDGGNGGPVPSAPAAAADPVMAALGLSAPLAVGGVGGGVADKHKDELSSLQGRLRVANGRLAHLERESARVDALPHGHPERSPSPPPVYGPDGTRRNTRANRWREKYGEERHACLERIMDLLPSTSAPGFISKRKRSRKIVIPVEEFPTYNFIGLIIGPRGKTQKDMENKTGCKIAIRGKGSIKEGAKGRRNGQTMEGDDEPLHVLITGEDPAAIDAAAEMVESMLVVIDDEKNVHKQNQLRELALLNGTLKDEEWCHVCGEKGHRDFECPKRFALGGRGGRVLVKCAICGDTSHPTRDCAQRPAVGAEGGEDGAKAEMQLDSDYCAFMAELDGKKASGPEGGKGDVCMPVQAGVTKSFLTVIQSARVVERGSSNGGESGESTAVAKAAAAAVTAKPDGMSWITTISSTISGAKAEGAPAVAATTAVVNANELLGVTNGAVTTAPAVAATDASTSGTNGSEPVTQPPPPPASGLPPSPIAGDAAPSVPPENLLPPPPPAGLPPPPAGLPPPPPPPGAGAYPPQGMNQPQYSHPYQQYQQPMGYQQQPPPTAYGHPPPPPAGMYGQPPPPAYGQQPMPPAYGQQQQQQQWGAGSGTAEWDPSSYYGMGGNGGDAGGAGGFNWWESSS